MKGVLLDNNPNTPEALNKLARMQMVTRLEADILQDMMICDIEGWDKTEYIRQLYEVLDHFMVGLKGEKDGHNY